MAVKGARLTLGEQQMSSDAEVDRLLRLLQQWAAQDEARPVDRLEELDDPSDLAEEDENASG